MCSCTDAAAGKYSCREAHNLGHVAVSVRVQIFARFKNQHVSKNVHHVDTSSSTEWISCARVGRAGRTCSKLGCGFPRQKFESVHVALRSIESLDRSVSCSRRGPMAPCWRTRSRHTGESPAMFPNAHTCSRDGNWDRKTAGLSKKIVSAKRKTPNH